MSANETSFRPGQSGNPNGRPPKGYSISETVREMMSEDPEIKIKLANKILEMALEGDFAAIKTLWGYMDGLPQIRHEVVKSELPIPIMGSPIEIEGYKKDAILDDTIPTGDSGK